MRELKNPQQEQAAQLVAEGRHEYIEIAEKVGVERRTLHRWRKDKKFAARVEQISAELSDRLLKRAIARKEYRVMVLNRMHTKIETLIEERAANMGEEIAGGGTGLLVRQYKVSGENQVTEYVYDSAAVRDLLKIQEQAAKELGQLVEKHEHKIRSVKDLSDDELAALAAELDDPQSAEGEDSSGAGETEATEG
jgi:transposase-like protein